MHIIILCVHTQTHADDNDCQTAWLLVCCVCEDWCYKHC